MDPGQKVKAGIGEVEQSGAEAEARLSRGNEEKGTQRSGPVQIRQVWGRRQPLPLQVRVLELENDLQKERQRLGELRKKHYELAGVAEGWEEGELAPDARALGTEAGEPEPGALASCPVLMQPVFISK